VVLKKSFRTPGTPDTQAYSDAFNSSHRVKVQVQSGYARGAPAKRSARPGSPARMARPCKGAGKSKDLPEVFMAQEMAAPSPYLAKLK
jgi:hypothetical protein